METGHWDMETGQCDMETGHWDIKTVHWEMETGHWEMETGHQEMETGHWDVKTGHWDRRQVTGIQTAHIQVDTRCATTVAHWGMQRSQCEMEKSNVHSGTCHGKVKITRWFSMKTPFE